MSTNSFPEYLARALRSREWTQADFARRMGVSTGSVTMWMSGKRRPDPASIQRIADVLFVSADDLLVIAGHRPPDDNVDPDSDLARILGMVRAIDWESHPERRDLLEGMFMGWAKDDRRARDAADGMRHYINLRSNDRRGKRMLSEEDLTRLVEAEEKRISNDRESVPSGEQEGDSGEVHEHW